MQPASGGLPATAWEALPAEADALLERLAAEFVTRALALIGPDASAAG